VEAGGGVEELAPGLHALGGRKGGRVHAFLAESGGELALVDTLWDADGREVLEAIRALGRRPSDLTRIAITHGHRSHLGGAAALKRATGATILGHPAEEDVLEGRRRAAPPRPRLLPLVLTRFRLGLALGFPKHPRFSVDEPLGEGDACGPFQVLHAPGHTPGHLALWWPERRVLIAGDAIATWPAEDAGWPGFNLDPEAHEQSLRRMASLEPLVVGVGHGDPLLERAPDRVHALAERARDV
jgi:glyoxylase-like metal-dependent hydrolase (beta-lactamase superfamily II)